MGERTRVFGSRLGLFVAAVATAASFVTSALSEAIGDRDWKLSGLEWPQDLALPILLVLVGTWLLTRRGERSAALSPEPRARFFLPPDSSFERSGLRWFISLRRTTSISLQRRQFCLVRFREGLSSCRYPGRMVLPFAMTPEDVWASAASRFFCAYKPQPGDVVVDAGAGMGENAIIFGALVGDTGRVVSVEAHPASFSRLESFCRLNRLRNVTCIQAALLDRHGTAYITDEKHWIANTVVAGAGTLPVPAVTLDALLDRLRLTEIDFLKMNIEGAELRALEGFRQGLLRTRNVAVACHDRRADRGESTAFRTKDDVWSLLEVFGFDVQNPGAGDYLYGTRPT